MGARGRVGNTTARYVVGLGGSARIWTGATVTKIDAGEGADHATVAYTDKHGASRVVRARTLLVTVSIGGGGHRGSQCINTNIGVNINVSIHVTVHLNAHMFIPMSKHIYRCITKLLPIVTAAAPLYSQGPGHGV